MERPVTRWRWNGREGASAAFSSRWEQELPAVACRVSPTPRDGANTPASGAAGSAPLNAPPRRTPAGGAPPLGGIDGRCGAWVVLGGLVGFSACVVDPGPGNTSHCTHYKKRFTTCLKKTKIKKVTYTSRIFILFQAEWHQLQYFKFATSNKFKGTMVISRMKPIVIANDSILNQTAKC